MAASDGVAGVPNPEFERESLEPRPSGIPGAGFGLFATRKFCAGAVVCVYRGRTLTTSEAAKLETAERYYLMRVGPQRYVDASAEDSCLARFINDARRAAKQTCWFDKQPDGAPGYDTPVALVRALRDIEAGEELFAPYGSWYWVSFDRAQARLSASAAAAAIDDNAEAAVVVPAAV